MTAYFLLDSRLGIKLPHFEKEWEAFSIAEQQHLLLEWERIRGEIPDQIFKFEAIINEKQEALNHEENFARSCELNSEIAEAASIINDLWLWYRINQNIHTEKAHR